jgi:hypothetical protein
MNSKPLAKGRVGCLLLLAALAVWAMPAAVRASDSDAATGSDASKIIPDASNPYAVIVTRNVFHLNPPPPPPEPDKPKVELPVVKITGFLNIGESSKALFVTQPKDKTQDPAYYCLAEGETSPDGKFQLVKIHQAEQSVDVINDGVPATLTVKDDSLTASAETPPAAPAQAPGPRQFHRNMMPGRPMFPPGRYQPPGFPGAGGFGLPSRMKRTQ